MVLSTADFLNAIKSDMRECLMKVVLGYDTPVTLFKDKIQSMSLTSSISVGLGGVQVDSITLKLMENAITAEQFNQQIDVEVFIGVKLPQGTSEYVSVGIYESDGWGKDDRTGIYSLELANKINSQAQVASNIITTGISPGDYARLLISQVWNANLSITSGVITTPLGKSWLMYDKVLDQLDKLGEACNGIFRHTSGFELVPFSLSRDPVDTMKYGPGESIIEIKRLSDYSKTKQVVQIIKARFTESTLGKLASTQLRTEGGVSTEVPMKTGCPTHVLYVVIGNEYGRIDSIIEGVVDCTVKIRDSYGEGVKHTIPVEVYGTRVESTPIDPKPVNDGSITYLENPYFQTSTQTDQMDLKVYSGVRYQIRYRGNPCYQLGDIINVEPLDNKKILVYKHTLNFRGGLGGTLEGVIIDE